FGTDRDFKGRLYNLVYGNDESNTDVFVYYAGHGAPDVNTQTGFFLPIDCETDYINITAYSGDQLFNNLAKINARSTTVVLDACFSGNGIIKGLSAVAIKPKDFSSIPNGVVLSSSSGTEPSAWFEENNHGLFTYYFLKAIHNGNADTDADGNLTANEIYQYASNNVTRKARSLRNLDQHPTIQGDARNNVLVKFSSPSVNDEE
ncbi:MAG: caspase family protein, partial [Cyclobacteriaceae bacterium]|nr:caspase family protein [Cyclobacteriaceae bacterium]